MTSAESEPFNTDELDIVSFLRQQHEQIRALFSEVERSSGRARGDAFDRFRRLLAVHETAEEQLVHPRARSALGNGDQVVEARLAEEHQAKQVLAELEKLDTHSADFADMFARFRQDVLAHAEAEERDEFPGLNRQLDAEQLVRMRRAAELAEQVAPTRPHPGVESAGANLLAGPFASMLDRIRDRLGGSGFN